MTLIASFSIQQHPVLIGDLMLSRQFDDLNYKPFPIPTHDDVNRLIPNATGRLIAGLVQKVNLLSPRLAVAWSGREDLAREIMITLKKEVEDPNFRWANLDTFLDRLPKQNAKLSLIGLFLDDRADEGGEGFKIFSFGWNSDEGRLSRKENWPLVQDCRAAGTGTSAFGKIAEGLQAIREPSREINPLEKAVSIAMSLSSQLMGKQMRTSAGLDEFYGGGFEIATILNGEIRKVDEISYHFLDVTLDKDDEMTISFKRTLKFCYCENLLFIRILRPHFLERDKEDNQGSGQALYVIRPVYLSPLSEEDKERLKESLEWPSLNSRRSVFYLYFSQLKKEASFIHMGSVDQTPVRYFETGESLEVELSSELLKRVSAILRKHIGQ